MMKVATKQRVPAIATSLCLAATAWLGSSAAAQVYPTKPIRMIVPYAAGGGLDAVTRIVTQAMSGALGQPIVVENRAGGGGTIGAETVAKAAPDGYTLLMAGNPELVINPILISGVRYSVSRDFVPIMLVAESPNIIAAHPSVKGTLADILAGKGVDGPVTIASPGQGSPQHLAIEAMRSISKADVVHVPYKGAAPAVVDAMGGQTKLVLGGAPPLLPQIRAGKLRALAVTQAQPAGSRRSYGRRSPGHEGLWHLYDVVWPSRPGGHAAGNRGSAAKVHC